MNKGSLYALALTGALAPMAASAECGEVSVGEMNWTSGGIITGITEFLLTQGYGCDVTVVPSATTTAITSLAENNEPDVVPEFWPNGAPAYYDLADQGKVVKAADAFSKGGTEHWLVPADLVEEHPELATIEGVLNNPELVGGRFHNCPDGWGCRINNDSLIEAFDFEGHGIEVFNHGSGETLKAALVSAMENDEPYFGYYWGPTAPLGQYDLVSVDMGPVNQSVYECNIDPECNQVGKSAFPAAPVFNVVTTDLAEREPGVHELMQNMTFSNEAMNQLLAWHAENDATLDEAAVHYLQNNQAEWSSWVSDEARANLEGMF
jgi:glycine betaine/proline transport system substrate-binding protein